jgi:hypothetical protein
MNFATIVGAMAFIGALPVSPSGFLSSHSGAVQVKKQFDLDEVIESLASRNAPPELREYSGERVALFPLDYDWEDQARVLDALSIIIQNNDSESLWEKLVNKIDDKRYSLTLILENVSAANVSVGSLCRRIVESRLFFVCNQKFDASSKGKRDVYLDVEINDIKKWRASRAGKSLFELQLEIRSRAIRSINRDERLSSEQKNKLRMNVRRIRDNLQASGKPFFPQFSLDGDGLYNSERAARARVMISP